MKEVCIPVTVAKLTPYLFDFLFVIINDVCLLNFGLCFFDILG